MNEANCIFCKIVRGEASSWKIYDDDLFLAFLDITQVKDGHTLVIPKTHHENLFEIPDDLLGGLAIKVKAVASIVKSKMATDGITLLQCNGVAGLQSVFHIHFHIVPGWENDHIDEPWISRVCDSDYLSKVHSKFKS